MKTAKRPATSKRHAAYAIITRSLIGESGQFLPQPQGAALLRKCRIADEGPYCSTEYVPDEAIETLKEYDRALETLHEYAEFTHDADMAAMIYTLRTELRKAALQVEGNKSRRDAALLKDAFQENEEHQPAFLESNEIDRVDLTGMEGKDASALALKLKKWNPKAKKVYKYRNGKRYISPSVVRLDLNDPLVKAQPWRDDLVELVKEKHLPVEYEQVF